MKALVIPIGKNITGLYIYCSQCKYTSKEAKCKHYDKQSYKARFHIPGTQGGKASKVLPTRDIDEAVKLTLNYQAEFEATNFQPIQPAKSNKPTLLVACMAKYVDYLADEDDSVEEHQKKNLSESHIDEVERCFRHAQDALVYDFKDEKYKGKYNMNILLLNEVNDRVIGKIHKYFIEIKEYSPRTYNKYMSHLRSFYTWLIEKERYRKRDGTLIENPFKAVEGFPVDDELPEAIEKDEFFRLLDIITPEKGHYTLTYNHKISNTIQMKKYNFYRPWLKDALWLFLLIGDRREAVVNLRFCDVKEDRNGEPETVEIENLKVNRILKRRSRKKRVNVIPASPELKELLYQSGYNQYRGSDRYILAPEEPISRKTLVDWISRAFSHYYNQLGTGKKKTLKSLKKTFLTSLELYLGRGKNSLTHSNQRTLTTHYIDSRVIAKEAAKDGFRVF